MKLEVARFTLTSAPFAAPGRSSCVFRPHENTKSRNVSWLGRVPSRRAWTAGWDSARLGVLWRASVPPRLLPPPARSADTLDAAVYPERVQRLAERVQAGIGVPGMQRELVIRAARLHHVQYRRAERSLASRGRRRDDHIQLPCGTRANVGSVEQEASRAQAHGSWGNPVIRPAKTRSGQTEGAVRRDTTFEALRGDRFALARSVRAVDASVPPCSSIALVTPSMASSCRRPDCCRRCA
jgi:hypothetical protein